MPTLTPPAAADLLTVPMLIAATWTAGASSRRVVRARTCAQSAGSTSARSSPVIGAGTGPPARRVQP